MWLLKIITFNFPNPEILGVLCRLNFARKSYRLQNFLSKGLPYCWNWKRNSEMYICTLYVLSLLRNRNDENNYVHDVKYTVTYTKLLYR